jgi:beta-lactamase class A
MATFFHLLDQKKINPDTKVQLEKADKKPGSGILQFLSDSLSITLLDAVKLMIILSDNTATNLVLDRLATSHEARMGVINDFMVEQRLKNTRMLNRLYSWQTKLQTPEAIRYGIGVSTPEDMVTLLEALYRRTLADSASCSSMLEILKLNEDHDMIPRYLPEWACTYLDVVHKTGSINETKVDVGLVLSDRANYAIAIFVDKHPDHRDGIENRGVQLAAHVSRAIWNHFAGMTGYEDRRVVGADVDWNQFPGGRWVIYRSPAAPFPHKERAGGFTRRDGTTYPFQPHYADSSIVVLVPDGFEETADGTNLIVHFHGHMNDNMETLERYQMPQAMIAQKINALLVLPQGPYRARDSFGGKMEDEGGFKRMVEDVLATMKKEGVVKTATIGKVIISAHSGGGRPAAFCLEHGGLADHVTHVFLFDALYEQDEYFHAWLNTTTGSLLGAYTEHLEKEHTAFESATPERARKRLSFVKSPVDHEHVVQEFFGEWLSKLAMPWRKM